MRGIQPNFRVTFVAWARSGIVRVGWFWRGHERRIFGRISSSLEFSPWSFTSFARKQRARRFRRHHTAGSGVRAGSGDIIWNWERRDLPTFRRCFVSCLLSGAVPHAFRPWSEGFCLQGFAQRPSKAASRSWSSNPGGEKIAPIRSRTIGSRANLAIRQDWPSLTPPPSPVP